MFHWCQLLAPPFRSPESWKWTDKYVRIYCAHRATTVYSNFLPPRKALMRRQSSQRVLYLVALAASACSSQPDATPFVQVTDSAGVTIVTNSDPAWQERVFATLPDSPDLVVGMREGPTEYLFSDIVDAVRSPSGRLMVADGTSGEIRIFNAEGRLETRFGGQGSGPGEFRYIQSLQAISGDSSVVWDYASGRLSVFGPDGELATDFDLHERRPRGIAWVSPGRYLLKVSTTTPTMPKGTETTVIRDTVRFEAWSPDGEVSPFPDDLYPAGESALLARVVEGKVRFAEAPRLFGRDVPLLDRCVRCDGCTHPHATDVRGGAPRYSAGCRPMDGGGSRTVC